MMPECVYWNSCRWEFSVLAVQQQALFMDHKQIRFTSTNSIGMLQEIVMIRFQLMLFSEVWNCRITHWDLDEKHFGKGWDDVIMLGDFCCTLPWIMRFRFWWHWILWLVFWDVALRWYRGSSVSKESSACMGRRCIYLLCYMAWQRRILRNFCVRTTLWIILVVLFKEV